MKISVITLHTVNNYGSVLQTYATQKVFESLGHTTEIIDYWRADNLTEPCIDKLLAHPAMQKSRRIWDSCSLLRKAVRIPLRHKVLNDRKSVQSFLSRHVNLSKNQYTSYEALCENPPDADVYVTGSDQVWNSIWNNGLDPAFFLGFAPAEKKKISFSASIGRTELDDWELEPMRAALSSYDAISVRESSAVALLREKLGLSSTLTLDPTLMLDGDQWRALANTTRDMEGRYLLVYQLNRNPELDRYIEQLAQKEGLDILRLAYGNSEKKKAGRCLLRPSVEAFLGAFSNAACVITDSFHATSFALNMGVDFISVAPHNFGTRINSILEMTHTQHRLLRDYTDFDLCHTPVNKKEVRNILDRKRDETLTFLKNALEQ